MAEPNQPPAYNDPAPGAPPGSKSRFPVWLIVILVVIGFFVLMAGTLGTLAIHGFRRYIAAAKTAEARASIAAIASDAAAAYDRERTGPNGAVFNSLCASASSPIPASIASVRGAKYQSDPLEWQIDKTADAGFACLGFELRHPQYYQYDYRAFGTNKPGDRFQAIAHGDLDGDGNPSTFELEGRIAPDLLLLLSPSVVETDPNE